MGPLATAGLRQMIAAGQAWPQCLVWQQGWPQSRLLGEVFAADLHQSVPGYGGGHQPGGIPSGYSGSTAYGGGMNAYPAGNLNDFLTPQYVGAPGAFSQREPETTTSKPKKKKKSKSTDFFDLSAPNVNRGRFITQWIGVWIMLMTFLIGGLMLLGIVAPAENKKSGDAGVSRVQSGVSLAFFSLFQFSIIAGLWKGDSGARNLAGMAMIGTSFCCGVGGMMAGAMMTPLISVVTLPLSFINFVLGVLLLASPSVTAYIEHNETSTRY